MCFREACRSRCSCDPLSLPNLDRLSGFCAESRHACDTASQDWMPSLLFKWEVGVNCDDEFSSSLFFILQKMITLRMRMLVRMWPGCWNTLCCCEEACKNDGGKGLQARGKLLREEREGRKGYRDATQCHQVKNEVFNVRAEWLKGSTASLNCS